MAANVPYRFARARTKSVYLYDGLRWKLERKSETERRRRYRRDREFPIHIGTLRLVLLP